MSLGILGATPQRRPFMRHGVLYGLGATVPAACWDKPGFKECNDRGWQVAERRCITEGLAASKYGGDWQRCKSVEAADYAYFGCVLRICPPPAPKRPTSSGGWTWKSTTPNASILAFQQHINTCLDRNSFQRIGADGKLGPATCGAFKTVGGSCPELFANDPIENIGICQAFTNPTKIGASSPVKDPTSAEAKRLDEQFGGLPWMVQDARAPELQRTLNTQLDGHDFLPNTVSGRLDAPMCGGMRWLDQNTGSRWMASWGQNCQAFSDPRPNPRSAEPAGPITTGPTGPIGPTGPGPTTTKPKTATAAMLVGGIVLAAGAGGYLLWKKYSGGA